jgi:protein tyrosine phosphatase (PTP) superfamily phosphohydrolase (DUF442 family)
MKKTILILVFWLFWGFALGTFILLGPLRFTVDFARSRNWPGFAENALVFFYIILLGAISFLLARYTSRKLLNSAVPKSSKGLHAGIPLLAAIIALFVMMNPAYNNAGTSNAEISKGFTIGPYPTAEKIQELKKSGYTAIISLLHPAVVPFEPKLLNEELEAAQDANIAVISIPMLPWVSENEAAVDSLKKIVQQANGRYYIHCYLGKDRVNVARRVVEQEMGDKVAFEGGIKPRSIDDINSFERGPIVKLEQNVYFTPLPTNEEYFGYILATNFQHIVALADMNDKDAAIEANKEKEALKIYGISHSFYDVNDDASVARVKAIVDSVKGMNRPLLVHSFRSDQPLAKLFIEQYRK